MIAAWPIRVRFRQVLALIKADAYDRLAARLHRLLATTWDDASREAIQEAIERLRGRERLSPADVAAIDALLRQVLGERFASEVEDELREIVRETYARALAEVVEVKPSWDILDTPALTWLQRHHLYWVRGHYDLHLAGDVMSLGEQAIIDGLSRSEAGRLFRDALGARFGQSQTYWEMFANHVITRSQEFGRVDGYEQAGIEYLQIRAVLDHRTSCICRNLHGRVIRVERASRLRARLMDAKTPEDVKRIVPWEPCERVMGVPSAELPEHLALPPYHFGCRTRTVVWKPPEDVRVEEKVMGSSISEKDRAILDQYTEEEYASWIDDIRRRAHRLQWNPKDLKEDLRDHAREFELTASDKDAYARMARSAIDEAWTWSAHVHKGELQFRAFSNKGIVIIDQHMRIRGFYNPGDIEKAFGGYKRRVLWLKLNRNPRLGSS